MSIEQFLGCVLVVPSIDFEQALITASIVSDLPQFQSCTQTPPSHEIKGSGSNERFLGCAESRLDFGQANETVSGHPSMCISQ